jgi:hypothetical protein
MLKNIRNKIANIEQWKAWVNASGEYIIDRVGKSGETGIKIQTDGTLLNKNAAISGDSGIELNMPVQTINCSGKGVFFRGWGNLCTIDLTKLVLDEEVKIEFNAFLSINTGTIGYGQTSKGTIYVKKTNTAGSTNCSYVIYDRFCPEINLSYYYTANKITIYFNVVKHNVTNYVTNIKTKVYVKDPTAITSNLTWLTAKPTITNYINVSGVLPLDLMTYTAGTMNHVVFDDEFTQYSNWFTGLIFQNKYGISNYYVILAHGTATSAQSFAFSYVSGNSIIFKIKTITNVLVSTLNINYNSVFELRIELGSKITGAFNFSYNNIIQTFSIESIISNDYVTNLPPEIGCAALTITFNNIGYNLNVYLYGIQSDTFGEFSVPFTASSLNISYNKVGLTLNLNQSSNYAALSKITGSITFSYNKATTGSYYIENMSMAYWLDHTGIIWRDEHSARLYDSHFTSTEAIQKRVKVGNYLFDEDGVFPNYEGRITSISSMNPSENTCLVQVSGTPQEDATPWLILVEGTRNLTTSSQTISNNEFVNFTINYGITNYYFVDVNHTMGTITINYNNIKNTFNVSFDSTYQPSSEQFTKYIISSFNFNYNSFANGNIKFNGGKSTFGTTSSTGTIFSISNNVFQKLIVDNTDTTTYYQKYITIYGKFLFNNNIFTEATIGKASYTVTTTPTSTIGIHAYCLDITNNVSNNLVFQGLYQIAGSSNPTYFINTSNNSYIEFQYVQSYLTNTYGIYSGTTTVNKVLGVVKLLSTIYSKNHSTYDFYFNNVILIDLPSLTTVPKKYYGNSIKYTGADNFKTLFQYGLRTTNSTEFGTIAVDNKSIEISDGSIISVKTPISLSPLSPANTAYTITSQTNLRAYKVGAITFINGYFEYSCTGTISSGNSFNPVIISSNLASSVAAYGVSFVAPAALNIFSSHACRSYISGQYLYAYSPINQSSNTTYIFYVNFSYISSIIGENNEPLVLGDQNQNQDQDSLINELFENQAQIKNLLPSDSPDSIESAKFTESTYSPESVDSIDTADSHESIESLDSSEQEENI